MKHKRKLKHRHITLITRGMSFKPFSKANLVAIIFKLHLLLYFGSIGV